MDNRRTEKWTTERLKNETQISKRTYSTKFQILLLNSNDYFPQISSWITPLSPSLLEVLTVVVKAELKKVSRFSGYIPLSPSTLAQSNHTVHNC